MREQGQEKRTVLVRLRHPETDAVLEERLDADTRFAALDALLYERGFVSPQKPGYGYLAAGHLCSGSHRLADYLPEGAERLDLRVLGIPQIMV